MTGKSHKKNENSCYYIKIPAKLNKNLTKNYIGRYIEGQEKNKI